MSSCLGNQRLTRAFKALSNHRAQHHLQIPVDNVARVYVLDRLKKLVHNENLVDVLEDVAPLDDIVKVGFWGNGPKRVSGQKSENRRTWRDFRVRIVCEFLLRTG